LQYEADIAQKAAEKARRDREIEIIRNRPSQVFKTHFVVGDNGKLTALAPGAKLEEPLERPFLGLVRLQFRTTSQNPLTPISALAQAQPQQVR
jgi:hypothetical protein